MSNLLHSFSEVHNCVVPFTSQGKLHEFGAEKPICCAKPANFDFLAINFTVWSHILSTGGDAVRASPPTPANTPFHSILQQDRAPVFMSIV